MWYLDELDDITFVRILEMFLVWMVLYNYIIPLSMYVSLELQKFLASQQFQWDLQLYDRARQTCEQCWTMYRVKGQLLHSPFLTLSNIAHMSGARDQPAVAHTSDINEELGLVTHLFSDKTGTITRSPQYSCQPTFTFTVTREGPY